MHEAAQPAEGFEPALHTRQCQGARRNASSNTRHSCRAARPDGVAWTQSFATATAAWRTVIGDTNSEREWRQRKADLEREG